jgi:hypothetical protein
MRRDLVFTAFDRPDYLRTTVSSWNATRNIRAWQTTFFVEPSEQQDEVTNIALSMDTTVTAVMNPERLGVLVNPWTALNTAFNSGADFVVLAEDDVIVSQDTLEYFEWASLEYETVYDVLAVNAFSPYGGKPNFVMRDGAFSPLIWGIWRNRWEHHICDTWDKDYSTGLPDGSQAGWDWNINRIMRANNFVTVKPYASRSNHIGLFGTHMTPDLMETSQGADFQQVRGRQRYREV